MHQEPEYEYLEERKWAELWTLPQAVEWQRIRCEGDVALYVRAWVSASMPHASKDDIDQVRQLDVKIGVSPRAMQQLRWEIADDTIAPTDELEQKRTQRPRVYTPVAAG